MKQRGISKRISQCAQFAVLVASVAAISFVTTGFQGKGGGGGGTTPPPNPEIAFADSGIKVMNADGTNVRTVVALKKGEGARAPTWSSDGQSLAYFGSHSGAVGIYTVRLDGTQRTRIVLFPSDGLITFTDWSRSAGPNGQKLLAFVAEFPGDIYNDVYVVNPDGTGLLNLTQTPDDFETDCAWSSDGSRLYVVRMLPTGIQFELREILLGVDGSGNVTKIGDTMLYQAPAAEFVFLRTSNTGDRLVFSNLYNSTTLGIHTMDLGAPSPTPARLTTGNDRWASFSQNDSKIAYHQSGSGGGIFVMNSDGSGKVRINSKGVDPNWKRPAPSGP